MEDYRTEREVENWVDVMLEKLDTEGKEREDITGLYKIDADTVMLEEEVYEMAERITPNQLLYIAESVDIRIDRDKLKSEFQRYEIKPIQLAIRGIRDMFYSIKNNETLPLVCSNDLRFNDSAFEAMGSTKTKTWLRNYFRSFLDSSVDYFRSLVPESGMVVDSSIENTLINLMLNRRGVTSELSERITESKVLIDWRKIYTIVLEKLDLDLNEVSKINRMIIRDEQFATLFNQYISVALMKMGRNFDIASERKYDKYLKNVLYEKYKAMSFSDLKRELDEEERTINLDTQLDNELLDIKDSERIRLRNTMSDNLTADLMAAKFVNDSSRYEDIMPIQEFAMEQMRKTSEIGLGLDWWGVEFIGDMDVYNLRLKRMGNGMDVVLSTVRRLNRGMLNGKNPSETELKCCAEILSSRMKLWRKSKIFRSNERQIVRKLETYSTSLTKKLGRYIENWSDAWNRVRKYALEGVNEITETMSWMGDNKAANQKYELMKAGTLRLKPISGYGRMKWVIYKTDRTSKPNVLEWIKFGQQELFSYTQQHGKQILHYVRVPNRSISRDAVSLYFWGCAVRRVKPISPTPNTAFLKIMAQGLKVVRDERKLAYKVLQLQKPGMSEPFHVHLTAIDVICCYTEPLPDFIFKVIEWEEVTTSMIAGLLLWYACLGQPIKNLVNNWYTFDEKSWKSWYDICKRLTVELKALQGLVRKNAKDERLDLSQLFEVEVLVNRIVTPINWAQEKENRISPNLTKHAEGDILTEAVKMFELARDVDKRRPPRRMEWKNYWEDRWLLTPPGAIHSQYLEDKEYLSDIIAEAEFHNKKNCLTAMPNETSMAHFHLRNPSIHAKTLYKWEWGKTRALYPCDLTSHIMASYGMIDAEECLPRNCVIGENAERSKVVKKVREMSVGKIPFCMDFEDFNSQHSVESMTAVLNAYLIVYGKDLCDDQRKAITWTRESLKYCKITEEDGSTYESKGTLMSGWRLTAFMNTALNYIYTRIAERNCGLKIDSIHSGDDIYAAVTGPGDAERILASFSEYNCRMQRLKCHFGGIQEFLRIDSRFGTQGTQYLPRACATAVHARIETSALGSASEYIRSCTTRAMEVISRQQNATIMRLLWGLQMEFAMEKWNLDAMELGAFLSTPQWLGGMSKKKETFPSKFAVLNENHMKVEHAQKLMRMPGLSTVAYKIGQTLGMDEKIGRITKHLAYVSAKIVGKSRDRFRIVQLPKNIADEVHKNAGRFKREKEKQDFKLAAMGGLIRDYVETDKELEGLRRARSGYDEVWWPILTHAYLT